jgi:hypothetical protein
MHCRKAERLGELRARDEAVGRARVAGRDSGAECWCAGELSGGQHRSRNFRGKPTNGW